MSVSMLIYMQDTGGASFILPLVNSITKKFSNKIDLTIMSHPLSSNLLQRKLDHNLFFRNRAHSGG